jgi:hypothetical protein
LFSLNRLLPLTNIKRNINFFGLIFTTVMSGMFVATDLVLLRSLLHLRKYKPWLGRRVDRWLQDGVFQLQRRAHEAHGQGVWKNLSDEVPITSEKILLPELPFESLPGPLTPISGNESLHKPESAVTGFAPHAQAEEGKVSSHVQVDEMSPYPGSPTSESHLVEMHLGGPLASPLSPSSTETSGSISVSSSSSGRENVQGTR